MKSSFRKYLIRFFKEDWKKNKTRLVLEVIGLILGIGATTVMAVTMPTPNLLLAYLMWEVSALCLIYGAISRGSVGLTLLYGLYFIIDGIGLLRYLAILP
tara:strand:+ start:2104 stop:2403 length:300 start_codon:yes stop_codon:yes gene_type:complete